MRRVAGAEVLRSPGAGPRRWMLPPGLRSTSAPATQFQLCDCFGYNADAHPIMKGPAMIRHRITRRTFLAAAGATVAAPAFMHARSLNKLNIAVIGTGGRGASNLAGVSSE